MPTYVFRCTKKTTLDFCPRCQAGCQNECRGVKISYCVPRSYSPVYPLSKGGIRYTDFGWWCECCFVQVFVALPPATQEWIREVARKAGSWWVNETYNQAQMAQIAGVELSNASKKTKTGRLWSNPDNECDQSMTTSDGADWIVADIDPKYGGNEESTKIYSLTKELASLIPKE